MVKIELNHTYIDIKDIPIRSKANAKWLTFFNEMPQGEAARFKYNNRQRAHQVRATIKSSARYYTLAVHTRIIHGTQVIHGTEDWLLYVWKEE